MDRHIIEYGRPLKIMVAVFWLCWLGVVAIAVFAPKPDPHDGIIAILIVLGFFLPILYMHLEIFIVRVVFDDAGLQTLSPWRHRRLIPWPEIVSVGFSPIAQWYVVQTNALGRIHLHIFLSGIDLLLTEIERRGVPVVRQPFPGPQHRLM